MLDPPREIMIDPPMMLDVGATYTCSADANPPASSYAWTRDSSGELLSATQTVTLTEALVIGQFINMLLLHIDFLDSTAPPLPSTACTPMDNSVVL